MPLIMPLHGALRPAVDGAVPWEALMIVGVPFLIAFALILMCRDVKRD